MFCPIYIAAHVQTRIPLRAILEGQIINQTWGMRLIVIYLTGQILPGMAGDVCVFLLRACIQSLDQLQTQTSRLLC